MTAITFGLERVRLTKCRRLLLYCVGITLALCGSALTPTDSLRLGMKAKNDSLRDESEKSKTPDTPHSQSHRLRQAVSPVEHSRAGSGSAVSFSNPLV